MTPDARRPRTRSDDVDGDTWTAAARSRLVCRASSCSCRSSARSSASRSFNVPLLRTSYGTAHGSSQVRYVAAPMPERCVIVVDADLPPGLAANAAAVLALTLGAREPALAGADLVDADGREHPGLIPIGLPVLKAPRAALVDLRG